MWRHPGSSAGVTELCRLDRVRVEWIDIGMWPHPGSSAGVTELCRVDRVRVEWIDIGNVAAAGDGWP
jgi:hypothetical protein